ncbi:hypothetical protein [Cohnella mopanensis]|uniref:hypothetical protein n=1 Tax=Cohnella mopanensis TaxID=2911966 RepID=UPI001EF98681|nr:hypothetical protein [Cohnella mopanensis]
MLEQALIIYYALSAVYIVICVKWKLSAPMLTIMVCLFLPMIGLLLILLRGLVSRGTELPDNRFHELINGFEQEGRYLGRPDVAKETNLVPLEEALVVNDLATRRRILLDVLKEDIDEKYIPMLEQAVNNEDTETSHYAVTAVIEIKRKLLLSIQKWSVQYENNNSDLNVLLSYSQAVKKYMVSGFMDNRMQLTYRLTYVKLLDQLIHSEICSPALFMEKINTEIDLGHLDEALNVSRLFLERFPESEEAYLTALKVYYLLKMKELFSQTLEALKQSKIRVSNYGLNTIRYWSAEGA